MFFSKKSFFLSLILGLDLLVLFDLPTEAMLVMARNIVAT